MSKEEKERKEKWEVEDAVHTLIEYQKIMKDKSLKEKAIEKLKERAEEATSAVKEFK